MSKNPQIEQIASDKETLEQVCESAVEAQKAAGVEQPTDPRELKSKDDIEAFAKASPMAYDPNKSFKFDYLRAELAVQLMQHYSNAPVQPEPQAEPEPAREVMASDEQPTFGEDSANPSTSTEVSTQEQQDAKDKTLGDLMRDAERKFTTQKPYHYPEPGFISLPAVFYSVNPKTGKVSRHQHSADSRSGGRNASRQDLIMLPPGEQSPQFIKGLCDQYNQIQATRTQAQQTLGGIEITPEVLSQLNALLQQQASNQAANAHARMGLLNNLG